MAEDDKKNTANQMLEGGAQEPTVIEGAGGDDQQQTGKDAAGAGQKKEEEGLKAALVAEQKKRQEAEERARQYEFYIQQQQQTLAQNNQQQTQDQQYDPEQYIQAKDLHQFGQTIIQGMQLQTIRSQNPDLDSVIGPGAGTQAYRPSDNVKKIITQNPSLYAGLDNMIKQGNPQAIGIAYDLGKRQSQFDELEKFKQAAEEHSRQNQIDNKINPTSPAIAGGGGGVSFESQIPAVGTQEFDVYWERLKGGEFDKRSA